MPVTFQEWEADLGQGENGLPSFSCLSCCISPKKCRVVALSHVHMWKPAFSKWALLFLCAYDQHVLHVGSSKHLDTGSHPNASCPSQACTAQLLQTWTVLQEAFTFIQLFAERHELLQNERRKIGACGFPLHSVFWHLGGSFHVLQ